MLMELAMDCMSMVLPVRGGATMRARCPMPMGVMRSTNACGVILVPVFQVELLVGIDGSKVVEENDALGFLGLAETDFLDPQQREIALTFLGRPVSGRK